MNFLDNQENLKHGLDIKELLLLLLGMNSTMIMFCFVLFFKPYLLEICTEVFKEFL